MGTFLTQEKIAVMRASRVELTAVQDPQRDFAVPGNL
jgi:hypothetical protein